MKLARTGALSVAGSVTALVVFAFVVAWFAVHALRLL